MLDILCPLVAEQVVDSFTFFVPGTPVAQGSKIPYIRGKGEKRKVTLVESAKALPEWREKIYSYARLAAPENWNLEGFFFLFSIYYMPRPESHFKPGLTTLKPAAPYYFGKAPDLDKLDRGRGDAMKGAAYKDDAKIVGHFSMAIFAAPLEVPGARLTVARLAAKPAGDLSSFLTDGHP